MAVDPVQADGHWRHVAESMFLAKRAAIQAHQEATGIEWSYGNGITFSREDVDALAGEVAECIGWCWDVIIGIEEGGYTLDREALNLEVKS